MRSSNRRTTAITLGIRLSSRGTYTVANDRASDASSSGSLLRNLDPERAFNYLKTKGFGNAQRHSHTKPVILLLDSPSHPNGIDPVTTTFDSVLSKFTQPYELIILSNRYASDICFTNNLPANIKVTYKPVGTNNTDDDSLNQYLQTALSNGTQTAVKNNEGLYTKFDEALNILFTKVDDLSSRGHKAASETAESLFEALTEQMDTFKNSNRSEGDYQTFRNAAINSINQSRSVLEQHRGMRQILSNIGLAVIGLGFIYLVGCAINYKLTGSFFYKPSTASKAILDDLQNAIPDKSPVTLINLA